MDGRSLDRALTRSGSPHDSKFTEVHVFVGSTSGIMVDAAARILSLLNQLALCTKRVTLEFESTDGAMGYLDRLRFFEFLSTAIKVKPGRPLFSMGAIRKGRSANLVELVRISRSGREKRLPTQLSERLGTACKERTDEKDLVDASFTVFGEIIDNVYSHVYEKGDTGLDGFVALQVYKNGGTAKVVVSDSGKGILDTLRPTIRDSSIKALSDTDLIVEIFRRGLSRHGTNRGCGLKASADAAVRYKTELDVRLRHCRVHLVPSRGKYESNTAFCSDGLPLLWGTHLCFDFRLDN